MQTLSHMPHTTRLVTAEEFERFDPGDTLIDYQYELVEVYRRLTSPLTLTAAGELDLDDVVPGFRCRVTEIFE